MVTKEFGYDFLFFIVLLIYLYFSAYVQLISKLEAIHKNYDELDREAAAAYVYLA